MSSHVKIYQAALALVTRSDQMFFFLRENQHIAAYSDTVMTDFSKRLACG